MAHVHVSGSDVDFDAASNESIYWAAWHAGYYWPTSCGAAGTCLDCWLSVEAGGEHLSELDAREARQLDNLREFRGVEGEALRLACLCYALGDVVVHKVGVRPVEEIYPSRVAPKN